VFSATVLGVPTYDVLWFIYICCLLRVIVEMLSRLAKQGVPEPRVGLWSLPLSPIYGFCSTSDLAGPLSLPRPVRPGDVRRAPGLRPTAGATGGIRPRGDQHFPRTSLLLEYPRLTGERRGWIQVQAHWGSPTEPHRQHHHLVSVYEEDAP
jgi:hypothetical protein